MIRLNLSEFVSLLELSEKTLPKHEDIILNSLIQTKWTPLF